MSDPEILADKIVMNVDPGACRFKAKVIAYMDNEHLDILIESACPYVKEFQKRIGQLERFDVLKMPFSENRIFMRGGETLKHSSCPIPTAVIKCAEVCAGLGLKRNVKLEYES